MKSRNYAIIALMSVTLIALELVWTRIFSAEFFYTFAFLVLSLAVLGLGLGALALRLFPVLDKERLLGLYLSLSGLAALAGPIILLQIGLNFSQLFSSWAMIGKFVLTIGVLSSAFLWGGVALAMLFKHNHKEMPRLYMADLIGAGVGVMAIIWMMNQFSTPVATFICAVPMFVAALLACRSWGKLLPAVLIVLAGIIAMQATTLLEAERRERGPVIYKHWDAMAKIKMFDFSGHYRGMEIDNVANSPVFPFDGDWTVFDTTEAGWGINVSYLIDRFDSCTFLSLGAGGGGDVFQALAEGATDVHAVEVNPWINHMMMYGDSCGYIEPEEPLEDATSTPPAAQESAAQEDETEGEGDDAEESGESAEDEESSEETEAVPAQPQEPPPPPPPVIRDSTGKIMTLVDYTGGMYLDPRVTVVTEDARTYIRRFKNKFDLIYSLSSNTWAALGSGSFALAENYLFTTEAFQDYWEAMTDSGFLSMEHQIYMPRLVSEVKLALAELGVENPTEHFAVYNLPQMRRNLLLLSKQPLTDEIRNNAYGELTPEKAQAIHLLYPAPDSTAGNLINRIVLEGWEGLTDSVAIDLSPCDDNRPFVAQLGRWKNFQWEALGQVHRFVEFSGFPLSKLIIVVILLVVLFLVVPFNLVPYFMKGDKLKAVPWMYFFTIGMAFMIVEIVLIQKYSLFIGASVYSIATVLLTLLVASGIGSRFSDKVSDKTAFLGIIVWLLLDTFVLNHVTGALTGLSIFPRALVSALLVAPLGFFMGMPFPKGTLRVKELIDWGFAVNGAASVLGATLIMLVAFAWGLTTALMLGALLYLLAFALMSARKAW